MNNEFARTCPTILLGRPFLKTAKAIINVDKGLLSVEFNGNVVSFKTIYDVKSSNDHVSLCALDTFESLKTLEEHDKFNELIDQATLEYVDNEFAKEKPSDDLSIFLDFITSINDEHALENGIKLKVLPSHLEYVFLDEKNTYLVISLKELIEEQEARLLKTLKRHRQAIGWSLIDLKGIDPSFCTHSIHFEEGAKNKVQPQRRQERGLEA
ncbi:Retrovirus-related Pol polyprotein from transposon 297 family [Cucumis melo var. makuwa]|uniref:Retrovirus-related Pol polyprotein from transposon 297 family n=1 Tax=Cucumis melo var. makuwa TaxID=1194695 RepID=A0A5D3CSW0_CUCMM|nr:Retrovirus-related Pol polyprotein from transposon 297 family [Cucumis melo var. makuwa]TYK14595.1 Retrovirus-related Pol polyprotein from transposon 297 family [Cucumis melo var. makuwa]